MYNLPENLVKEFVKATNDTPRSKPESFMYGTVISVTGEGDNQVVNVMFDGASEVTPCATSVSVQTDDRVTVMLKNRQAVITSNVTRPSMSYDYLETGDAEIHGHLKAVDGSFSGTLTFDWQTGTRMAALIKIGSDQTSPLIIYSAVNGNDSSNGLYADSIQMGRNGGREWAQMDMDDGFQWSSDRRIKEDIKDIDPELALKFKPVSFSFISDIKSKKHFGFIAQDVQEVEPTLVTENEKSGYLGLNYTGLIAPLYALVQKQQKQIEDLERRLEELESERNQELPD